MSLHLRIENPEAAAEEEKGSDGEEKDEEMVHSRPLTMKDHESYLKKIMELELRLNQNESDDSLDQSMDQEEMGDSSMDGLDDDEEGEQGEGEGEEKREGAVQDPGEVMLLAQKLHEVTSELKMKQVRGEEATFSFDMTQSACRRRRGCWNRRSWSTRGSWQ